jgi:hypothetical protein
MTPTQKLFAQALDAGCRATMLVPARCYSIHHPKSNVTAILYLNDRQGFDWGFKLVTKKEPLPPTLNTLREIRNLLGL